MTNIETPKENGDLCQSDLTQGNLSNHFLIAMPGLDDTSFAHTVTLVCEHSAEGAMGIVINAPLNINMEEIFQQMQLTAPEEVNKRTVFAGGPVQLERGFVLHKTGTIWNSTLEISKDISLTVSKDIIAAIANEEAPPEAIVALGYAGWGAGQLEEEIAENTWLTLIADSEIIFNTPCEQRWALAAQSLGIDLNLMSSTAGHA